MYLIRKSRVEPQVQKFIDFDHACMRPNAGSSIIEESPTKVLVISRPLALLNALSARIWLIILHAAMGNTSSTFQVVSGIAIIAIHLWNGIFL